MANEDSGAGGSGETSGCGGRTGMRGKTVRSLTVSGKMRSYVAYLPDAANPMHALPFVYVFHGASQTGANLYDMTEYSTLADSEGIAVVFPDGQGASSIASMGVLAPWNVSDNGAPVCGAGALANNATSSVDFAFMDAIKADIEQDQCLDSDHVFATGFSMGGYFTHHVTCDRPDIRAGAPHSGGTEASLDGWPCWRVATTRPSWQSARARSRRSTTNGLSGSIPRRSSRPTLKSPSFAVQVAMEAQDGARLHSALRTWRARDRIRPRVSRDSRRAASYQAS